MTVYVSRKMTEAAGLVLLLGLSGCSGLAEQRLSPGYGRLEPCSGPHCVSSQEKDAKRLIAPLVYSSAPDSAQASLVQVVESLGGKTVSNRPGYLHAMFETNIFGFTDDVEFVFVRGGNRIDVRSSSRSGYYDFEVNRNRVEKIRAAFDRTQP